MEKTQKMMGQDQLVEFLAAVVRSVPRDLSSDIAQSWITNQEALAKVLREALSTPAVRTWQSLLDACRQSWVNSDFNEENFPMEPVASDEGEWEVHEHHFSEVVNGEDAFRRLEELGYKLCGPRRAMEFVTAHPDIQLNHPLVVTVRWRPRSGRWYAPLFYRDGGERLLRLCWLGNVFYPNCGWLVLRKRP